MRSGRLQLSVVLVGSLLLLGACGNDPGGGDTTSSTISQPSTTSSVPDNDSPSTVHASTTSTAPAAGLATLPLVAEEVVASDDGIFLVLHGDGAPIVQLWDQPTALGFMVGEDLVVAQESVVDQSYPRRAEGPILVFDPTGVRALPLGDERLVLFDAGVVDGRPVALATSRTGNGPGDTDERLLLVDLLTEERTDLGSVGGWESGVSQARLADGHIVLVGGGEAPLEVMVLATSGTEEWRLPTDPEFSHVVTIREGEVVLLGTGFVDPDFTPSVTLDRYSLSDGTSLGSTTITLRLGDGVQIDGGYCFIGEWMGEALVCDQTYGGPLVIDVFAGTVGYFGEFERGVLTVPRAGHSRYCDPEVSIGGDFDGDGTSDLATFDTETSELVVCTTDWTYLIAGSGQGEVLIAADLNGDGSDEILTGGTAAWGAGADVVAIVDGVLDYVHTTNGDRLTLWEGLPPDGFLAYGCDDFTGEGQRQVAVIEGHLSSGGEASWERSIYRIEGHDANLVTSDNGTFDPSGSPDPLSTPEMASLQGDPCGNTDHQP